MSAKPCAEYVRATRSWAPSGWPRSRPRPCATPRTGARSPASCASGSRSTPGSWTATTEARLTYLGANHDRPRADETLVVDIGGGSTELVVGRGDDVSLSRVARRRAPSATPSGTSSTTRPRPPSSRRWRTTCRHLIDGALTGSDFARARARHRGRGHADVAGGDRSGARSLRPRAGARVRRCSLDSIQRMYSQLAAKTLEERLAVPGLHAGRAPTIVAGVVILIQVMRAFGLQRDRGVRARHPLRGRARGGLRDGVTNRTLTPFQTPDRALDCRR